MSSLRNSSNSAASIADTLLIRDSYFIRAQESVHIGIQGIGNINIIPLAYTVARTGKAVANALKYGKQWLNVGGILTGLVAIRFCEILLGEITLLYQEEL